MPDLEDCPVVATLDVVAGKWTPLIFFHLRDQPRRFNALRRLIPDITQRMLTLHLRALEGHGVVSRTVFDTVPPQVEYRLTPKGLTLAPILEAMERWGETALSDRANRAAIGPLPRNELGSAATG